MKTNNQNNRTEKLTESDIDRITKKVLQSEQGIPELRLAKDFYKDFYSGLKGIYSGRGYLPSKYHSAMERVGKTFLKDWERQENLEKNLIIIRDKIEKSSMKQETKDKFSKSINEFISKRTEYKQEIENFLRSIGD